ncbi:hypothetical protein B0H16DRAFT_1266714, partial [Mycena metata]
VSGAPVCLPRAPEWFMYAHAEMTRRKLGAHFNALLAAWARIEAASRFEQSGGALSKQQRPEQVSRWIQCGRGRKGRLDTAVLNPAQYEAQYKAQWWAWWGSLQPTWRGKDSDGEWVLTGPYGKDWGGLMFWGQNGLLSVVAALYFWGCAVQEDENLLGRWERAVHDAAWICE